MNTKWICSRIVLPTAALLAILFCGATAPAQTFTVIENFGSAGDGSNPQADLILSGGVLYGTTKNGGSVDYGTIFKINTNSTGYTVLRSFPTETYNAGNFTNTDGAKPVAGLTLSGNMLYGTTREAGFAGKGTVFKMDTNGNSFVVLKHFLGTDGNGPFGGVVLSGTTLFGTTVGGGSGNNGTVFKVNTDGTSFAVLTNFPAYSGSAPYTNTMGGSPYSGLTLSGSTLYGTTKFGGAAGNGTLFKIDPNGSGFAVLKHFPSTAYNGSVSTNSDGANPMSSLTLSGSALYGTTYAGGTGGYGTVFKISTNGTGFTTLYNFTNSPDGANPSASLILSSNTLYGTTQYGGDSTYELAIYGTIFQVNTDGSGYTVLKSLTYNNGANPQAGLVLSGTTLYGTASGGLGLNQGDVFALNFGVPPTILAQPENQWAELSNSVTFAVAASGVGPLAYQWQFNATNLAGQTNSSLTVSNATFANVGNYRAVITNIYGSSTSSVATLLVSLPPAGGIIFQDNFDPSTASSLSSYFGGDATNVSVGVAAGVGVSNSAALRIQSSFNSGPNGYGYLAGQWQDASVYLGNSDTNLSHYALSFDALVTGDAAHQSGGGFQLVIQAGAGQNFSPPFPAGTLQTYQASQGGSDLLISQSGVWQHFVINLGGSTFQGTNGTNQGFNPTGNSWQVNFQMNAGDWGTEPQTNSTLLIDNLVLATGSAPTISQQPVTQMQVNGSNLNFSVTAAGSGPFSYQWLFNGAAIAGATNSSLVVSNTTSANAGGYQVVVANPFGSVTSVTVDTTPYRVNWFKVAGGGGTSTGDVFTVSGTFGQHDAGGPMAGGGFSVMSGFWSPLGTAAYSPGGVALAISNVINPSITSGSVFFGFGVTGTAPIFFQWQRFGGAGYTNLLDGAGIAGGTNSGLSLTIASNNFNGSYQLVAASPYGSLTSSVVNVGYYAPFASPVFQYLTNSVGNFVSFGVSASGNPLPTYQWLANAVPIPGATGSGHSFLATNAGTFSYSVQLQNAIGTVTYGIAQLVTTNGTAPQITQQPQSVTNAIGSIVNFAVTATGAPAPTYQWRFNGTNISGANGTNYSFLATNGGNFDVVLANYYGSVTSSVATLTLTNGTMPVILAQPQSRTNVSGSVAAFSVTASGAPSPSYQWRFNGSPVGSNSASYGFVASASGNVDVVAANYYGSVTSRVAVLTVAPPSQTGGFSMFQAASVVVGQTNFTNQDITASQIVTPGPTSVAISSFGKMAVGEQSGNRALIWNSIPVTNGTPADVVVGQPNFTSAASGVTASQCYAVEGVTFSPDGSKLIVCDAGNNRVLIWNSVPTSSGQPADVVVGQTDFTTSTGGTAANKLSYPSGVLVTPNGKLLVTEYQNHRVLIFNSIPTVNGASADVVIGQPGMTTINVGNAANQMNSPWGCAYSSDGRLLVTDTGNNRVLVFNSLPTVNGASADVVIGQSGFGVSTSGTTANSFYLAPGVAVSPSGVLAIGEFGNNRVLVFNSIPTVNGAAADTVLGQPDFTSNTSFNGGVSSNSMSHVYQVAFASDGRLLVSGRDMLRVMIFNSSPADYNQITGQLLGSGSMQLSYLGVAGTNYALDRTFNLAPPNWVPIVTNPAGVGGLLVFTNTPVPTTNNFWRVRSVP